jgi:hypothetical protein
VRESHGTRTIMPDEQRVKRIDSLDMERCAALNAAHPRSQEMIMAAGDRRPAGRIRSAAIGFVAGAMIFGASTAIGQPNDQAETEHWPGYHSTDNLALPGGDGASADGVAINTGPEWNVLNWGPGPLAAVPHAYAIDQVAEGRTVQKVFVSSGANQDIGAADTVHNMSISNDSGTSFLTTERHAATLALNMVRLADGSLLAIEFIPKWTDAGHTSVDLQLRRSTNGGRTWRNSTGRFTPPEGKKLGPMDRGLRVHRAPMLLADGTLVVPAYTAFQGERGSSIFLQSTDQGVTWTLRSQIPANLTTNEVGWSMTTAGDLIAIIRTADSPARLQVTRSKDLGKTWDTAKPLIGPDGQQVVGIYPDLVLQPNGILLLSTGRPDNRVLISNDGTGRTWDTEKVIFANPPSQTGNGRYDGSSGNTAMINVAANRTLFFGDKCHTWGCQGYHEQYGIFASNVSAVTEGSGKLDLATQLRTGAAKLTGSFAAPDRRFPESRPAGAFDGSSRRWSAATLAGDSPELMITLDRAYRLSTIGLMLGSGEALSAEVSLSTDGKTWSAPVVVARDRRDAAMRYTAFEPQQARYIKITAPPGRPTPITEFEAYAEGVQTFENDPLYAVPRGFSGARNATTTDQRLGGYYTDERLIAGDHSSASLRLWDKDFNDHSAAVKITEARPAQLATFRWSYGDFRGPFHFGSVGRDGDQRTEPWQFRLVPGTTAAPGQRLEVFDGTAWTGLGKLDRTIALDAWVPVELITDDTSATVIIDGQTFRTEIRAAAATAQAGVFFSSGDDLNYGTTFHLDDLAISDR